MFLVSMESHYALAVLTTLATRYPERLSMRDLAQSEGLPSAFLTRTLGKLRRAGLIDALSGRNGGYTLDRPPFHITVRDVVAACRQSAVAVDLRLPGASATVAEGLARLSLQVEHVLATSTIAELAEIPSPARFPTRSADIDAIVHRMVGGESLAHEERLARALLPLLDVLEPHWARIHQAWSDRLVQLFPELEERLHELSALNINEYRGDLARGMLDTYVGGMHAAGMRLARGPVPFDTCTFSVHLFEEGCYDALRPILQSDRGMWENVSEMDRLMHAGLAALAKGYFGALQAAHEAQVLSDIEDTTSTLARRILIPLDSIVVDLDMLLKSPQTGTRARQQVHQMREGASRIQLAMEELQGMTRNLRAPARSPSDGE